MSGAPVEVYLFFAVFGLVAVAMLWRVIKNRGWRGAMFGAPVRRLVSELDLGRKGMIRTRLRLHVLDPSDPAEGPHVGVEVVLSTIGSWEMKPISLTRIEAQRLAEELALAARESASGGPARR
jgi:hypothetical protein